MPAKMTKTAWDRGAKNALIVLSVILAFTLSVTGLVAWYSGRPFRTTLMQVFLILYVVLQSAFLIQWVRHRNSGGEVLLDCGPHPTRKLFFFNGLTFLVMGSGIAHQYLNLGWFSILIGAAAAAHFIILALGRLQIREGGVWQYWDLLPWSRIDEYEWSDDGTLLVKCKPKFGLAGYGALPVPPERKDEVDRLIQEKAGLQPANSSGESAG